MEQLSPKKRLIDDLRSLHDGITTLQAKLSDLSRRKEDAIRSHNYSVVNEIQAKMAACEGKLDKKKRLIGKINSSLRRMQKSARRAQRKRAHRSKKKGFLTKWRR